ncbi:MAG: PEP-CTERM sorting domain-containing protein [Pirellulales bacterium]
MTFNRLLSRVCKDCGKALISGSSRALLASLIWMASVAARGDDVVLDWNAATREAMRLDRTATNPGWSSRAMAMVNGAIYDSFMAIDRTHTPFLVDTTASADTSRDAAATQAAYRILNATYPGQATLFDATRTATLSAIPDGPGKTAGLSLGELVAGQYLAARANDGASAMVQYLPTSGAGHWRPDPMNPGQQAWGPGWGQVQPFTLTNSRQFQPPPAPSMTSQQYADAFNEVKSLGALNSTTRTADQTEMAIFWAYDRAGMGPPPRLFNQVVADVAAQRGNSVTQNARLFAMSMVAQADAGIAAWDSKFVGDYWRPITGIREADTDGNPLTQPDPNWIPLGAPGAGEVPDFTPPFPAYVSGHATFGGAVFGALTDFYGTDDIGFTLSSGEMVGITRSFDSFSQASEENGRSRVYMGVHWNFDDTEGRALGGQIADWVSQNHFQAVPEPGTLLLAALALLFLGWRRLRR